MKLPSSFQFPWWVRNGSFGTIINAWPTAESLPAIWDEGEDLAVSFTVNWRFDDVRFYNDENNTQFPEILPYGTGVLFKFWSTSRWDIHWTVDGADEHIVQIGSTGGVNSTGSQKVAISIPAEYRNDNHVYEFWIQPMVAYHYYNLGCYMLYKETTHEFLGAIPYDNLLEWPFPKMEYCACQSLLNIAKREDGYESGEGGKLMLLDPAPQYWPEVGYPIIKANLGYNFYEAAANFKVTAAAPLTAPKTFYFDALESTGDGYTGMSEHRYSISKYSWVFGDGQVGFGPQPEHTYQKPGTYNVSLTITTESGASDSVTQQIKLLDAVPLIMFDPDYCYFPASIKPEAVPNLALYVKNEGGATVARIDVNITDKAEQPLISNISIPGYTQPTPYKIAVPPHPISWYLGGTPTEEGYYTIHFHLINASGVEVDSIDYTFKITIDAPVIVYDYNDGWQGAGDYQNVPGKTAVIYIASEGEFNAYTQTPGKKSLLPVITGVGGLALMVLGGIALSKGRK